MDTFSPFGSTLIFDLFSLKMSDINRVKFSKESKPLQYSIVGIGETTFHYFSNTLLQFLF